MVKVANRVYRTGNSMVVTIPSTFKVSVGDYIELDSDTIQRQGDFL